ncbi:MAG: cell division protein FtsX [Bacteroidetes bacterium]|uniref:Cell division protein FtsX n=1 Tax=Candidatus Enterocola intestinipullorum TaxID=2840783 RepID=A0A9D9EH39_9BACT|nr:cell division protein FtsX [Candidatus Enterocola intestinipullorum]
MKNVKSTSNNLFNSRLTSIISISLVIFLIGLTTTLVLFAGDLSVAVRENITLSVVLNEDAKASDVQKLQKKIDAEEYTKSTEYIDKERAISELTEELGHDPTEFLGYNPLLASLELKLVSEYANNDSISKIEKALRRLPEVREVIYQKNLVQAVNDNVQRISVVLLALSVLLLIVSYALISNTVRLSIYAKRFLIHTMKLVGATGRFIRRPFLAQGMLMGLLSSFIAMGMLSLSMFWAQSEVGNMLSTEFIDSILISFAVMIIAGLLITFVSTYISVSRYLRLSLDSMYYI